MRKIFTICLVLLYSMTIAQVRVKKSVSNKTADIDVQKFTGVGIFKIGIDTNTLIGYAETHTEFIRDINSFASYSYFTTLNNNCDTLNGLLRLKRNSNTNFNPGAISNSPDVSEYFLTQYEVSGIKIKAIQLKFYKGHLIGFHSDENSDLINAMTQKYGEPKTEEIKKTCDCLYKLTGITRQLEDINYLESWNNGPIITFYSLHKSYDEHCNEQISSYFTYSLSIPELDKWEFSHIGDGNNEKENRDLSKF